MWLENLKELKKAKGMTSKQIAEATKIPEGTIKRIFAGDTDDPYVSTIHRIVLALGGSLDEILADTNVVLSSESMVEVKENADIVEAKLALVLAEDEMLQAKVAAQATEIELLKNELSHRDELLALHKYYKTHIEQLVKHMEQLIKKEGI